MLFTFAELLRSYRERASLDQAILAAALGLHRNTIGRWEQGDCRPRSRELVLRLADELSLSPTETDQLLRAADFPTETASPPQLIALHQLRPPVVGFIGREQEAAQLSGALRAALGQGGVAVVGAIQGMGGVGKTELACDVAHRLDQLLPDAQILVDLRGSSATPLTASQALQAVIRVFSPESKLPDDPVVLQQLYRSALRGKRALILADDARDATHVQALVPPDGSALLVTSRVRFSMRGMIAVHLEPLDEDAAVALLMQSCSRLSVADAQALARACGQLPLALCISSGIVQNDIAVPVRAYLQQLSDQRQRLRQLRDPDDPQLDVEASLALSYAQLDAAAQQVFCQLGVLAADFATPLAQAVVAQPPEVSVEPLLRLLLRRNLVTFDATRCRWRLHDLVRDLARQYLEAAGTWASTQWRFAHAVVQIVTESNDQYTAGGGGMLAALARFDAERPHIDAARHWIATHAGTPEADALLIADAQATFFFGGMRYDRRRESLPQVERALAAAERLGDRAGQARLLASLGRIYLDLGETRRALATLEPALALVQTIGSPHAEAVTLNFLGLAHVDLGNARHALPLFERALAMARRCGHRYVEAVTLHNLGFAYANMGDPLRAIHNLEQALIRAREIGDRRGEAVTLANLGGAYTDLGNPGEALVYCEQALTITRLIGDRLSEGRALTTLALPAADIGDAQRALAYGAAALAILQEIGDQRSEGYALLGLAAGHTVAGDRASAQAAFEASLSRFRAVAARYSEAECSWRYGLALHSWGEWERALSMLEAVVRYEQEIGHSKAAEHAELLACLARRAPCRTAHTSATARDGQPGQG